MRLILAPMQGLVDDVMRDVLTRIGGFDACVSEFVRVTHTVHGRGMWIKLVSELEHNAQTFAGIDCTVQILGSDAENMALNAQEALKYGAKKIDINFGCPAPTVNRHQGGSVLLREPQRIEHIVKTVRAALPEHIPLSAKMRLGYEDKALFLDCAHAIENGGACEVTVHARTKADGYKPPAHWDKLPAIQQAINIPVIANGEIWTLENAKRCLEISGCVDLMLGRGAVTRPDLVNQIRQSDAIPQMSWQDLVQLQLEFLASNSKTENGLVGRYKQWLSMLTKGYSEAETLWVEVKRIKEIEW